jgi:hypothetical protein
MGTSGISGASQDPVENSGDSPSPTPNQSPIERIPTCCAASVSLSLCLTHVRPPARLLFAIEALWTRNMRVASKARCDGRARRLHALKRAQNHAFLWHNVVDKVRLRQRHLQILQLVGHINKLHDMFPHTSLTRILSIHHLCHKHASIGFRRALEVFFNLGHELLSI